MSWQHSKMPINRIEIDDAEILTNEVHDPYARTTGAWK